MNLIGESFDEFVNDQIDVRQKLLAADFRDNNNLVWQNSKTGYIRLTSCVDIKPEATGYLPINLHKYSWLAENKSLWGDVLAKTFVLDTGLTNTNTNPNRIFQGITRDTSIINNFAYGLGGTEFGISPIPGIENLLVKHKNDGSLREAQINIKANNRFQFELLDILYLRLGYSVLIEWGNSIYYNNKGEFDQTPNTLQNYIFTQGHNHLDVHREILKYRYLNSGNYDGMIGRVKNFTWSVTKDGVYNVTLNVISYGDLIDSLRVNNLYGTTSKQNAIDVLYEEADIFTKSKSKHAIGKHFFNIKKNTENTITKVGSIYKVKDHVLNSGLAYTPDPNILHIAIIQFAGGSVDPQYYYRLGSFLEFLQYNSQIFNNIDGQYRGINNPKKAPYFEFDFDTNTNIIYQSPYQFSSDPRICIMQKEQKVFGQTILSIYKNLEPSKTQAIGDVPNVVALMNVYMNFEFLLNKLEELIDDKGKVNLTDFLKAICQGINESFGYYNQLTPFIDTDNNMVKLIEKRTFPGYEKLIDNLSRPIKNTVLNLFGFNQITPYEIKEVLVPGGPSELDVTVFPGYRGGSFVRDFTFQTNLTNEFSSIVAIGAQAAGGNISEDSTLLGKLNSGMIDRIFPQKLSGDNLDAQTVEEINARLERERQVLAATGGFTAGPEAFKYDPLKQQLKSLKDKYQPYVDDYIKNIKDIYSPKDANGVYTPPKWNNDVFDTQKDLIKNLITYNNLYYATQKAYPSVSVGNFALPLNLKITMDGLAGMKILQQFQVNTNFLPAGYDDDLIYLLINISHRVENNTWVTELDTIFVPRNPEEAAIDVESNEDIDNPITQAIAASEYTVTSNQRRPFYQFEPSQNALNLIQQFEGFRTKAYQDSKGVWTIGYGSTTIRSVGSVRGTVTASPRPVREGDEFSVEYLQELFKLDLADRTRILRTRLGDLEVTQNEYDALVSFSYNVGTGWASEDSNSKLRRELFRAQKNEIPWSTASEAILEWNKIKKKDSQGNTIVQEVAGLTRRRKAEQYLFNLNNP